MLIYDSFFFFFCVITFAFNKLSVCNFDFKIMLLTVPKISMWTVVETLMIFKRAAGQLTIKIKFVVKLLTLSSHRRPPVVLGEYFVIIIIILFRLGHRRIEMCTKLKKLYTTRRVQQSHSPVSRSADQHNRCDYLLQLSIFEIRPILRRRTIQAYWNLYSVQSNLFLS